MSGFFRLLTRLIDGVGQFGIWLIVPIMALVMTEVVMRSVFGKSLVGVHETVEFLLVAYVFLGLGRSWLTKAHVTVTMLIEKLSDTPRQLLDRATALLSAAIWLLASWQTFRQARGIQLSNVISPTIDIPIYPFIYLTGLGCGLMGIAMLVEAIAARSSRSTP